MGLIWAISPAFGPRRQYFPIHGMRSLLLSAHVYRGLISACNPMVCPIHVRRAGGGGGGRHSCTQSGRPLSLGAGAMRRITCPPSPKHAGQGVHWPAPPTHLSSSISLLPWVFVFCSLFFRPTRFSRPRPGLTPVSSTSTVQQLPASFWTISHAFRPTSLVSPPRPHIQTRSYPGTTLNISVDRTQSTSEHKYFSLSLSLSLNYLSLSLSRAFLT